MKLKKSLVILRILIAVILLFSGNDYLYSYANTFEQNDSIITIEQAITIIQSSIPDELFGGLFLNEQGDIVVNVTDLDKVCVDLIKKRIGPLKIICHEVNVPLSYLEKAHEALVPHMAELGIISLDANDVTNKLDVVLKAQSREAECFIADIIDLDFVNISVMPDNYYLKFTEGDINDNSTLEGNYFSYYGNNRSYTTIFPGMRIFMGNSSYTVGPKWSSYQFLTAGHAVLNNYSLQPFYAYSGVPQTLVEIGTCDSYVFGLYGDRMTVNVDLLNNNFNLPDTNSFIVGTGTYSYSSNIIVGMAVEMHGASSGISSGSVVTTNQTVFVNNTTVGNLAKSDYTCQAGDSGAGIFSNNAFYVTGYCYGIQSIGVFSYGSTISTYSYFTQY